MTTDKKGFVVYFNNYPLMASLPLEQRGLLFSVLMVYADRVWRDSSVTLDEVLEGFSGLAPETRMACGFMGAAIRNDTEKWLSKQEYRQKRRQDPPVPTAQTDQRAREDMEYTRRLMERLRADG